MNFFDFNSLCDLLGVYLYSYADRREVIQTFHLEQAVKNSQWICLFYKGHGIIFFDSTLPFWKIHLNLAKALGCLVLGYVNGKTLMLVDRIKVDVLALKVLLLVIKVNPRFPMYIIRADFARLKSRRKQKALPPYLPRETKRSQNDGI